MSVNVTPESVDASGNADSGHRFELRIAKGMEGPWVQRIQKRFPEVEITTRTTEEGATILMTDDRDAWVAAVDALGKYPRRNKETLSR